jgi:branched-subunit amino acid transport protein
VTVDPGLLFLIFAMGAATYLPRWFPLFFLSTRRLPPWVVLWLDFIPAAVLGALVVPALVTSGEPRHLDLLRRELIVAVPTFLFALKTKSMGGTVLFGMALFWAAGKLTGR